MVIYFAGNGRKNEDDKRLLSLEERLHYWGVLLTYKDLKTKNNNGNLRFHKILARKKLEENETTVQNSFKRRRRIKTIGK